MSASVGTTRAGSNRHTKSVKAGKGDNVTSSQQQTSNKSEGVSNKVQPTQEQLRFAQITNTGHADTDPRQIKLIKELAELTGKSEDVVVIALHDTGNDADKAVMSLLEGGDEQGEWKEQGGKRKKKNVSSQKDTANHITDEQPEGKNKDRSDRDGERDKDGASERQDVPSRRGRRNGGPPPRLARGRGRDRGTGGDRDRDRNTIEDWDNEEKPQRNDKERSGGDRGRSRGRGGFGRKSGNSGGNRGRYNNSGDRDNRGYNRVPRFDKMNNSQPMDGPEIDTWTNETAETNTSKDTDWDNWKDSWGNEEDQWTGTLEETKVFTPSQLKLPESEPAVADPPSSLGQRLDVGSLFIETAKFPKAPDYTKPSGDAYINQFNQAATESIKNSIGIGTSSRQALGMNQPSSSNPLGLSNLGQSSASAQSSVLSSLPQDPTHSSSIQHTMSQLSQISQSASQAQAMSQMGITQQAQVNNNQAAQSRMPSVMQQQQHGLSSQASMTNSLQQRPKPQRSKLPPPSKIPSSAVEMPGHIPLNTQLDLQFGIDFGTEASFGFGGGSGDNTAVTSSYSTTTNGTSSVISNHLNQGHVSQSSGDGGPVPNILPSSSTPSKVPSGMETQTQSRQGVFHNSVYTASQTKNDGQSLDRDQSKINDSISFPSTQLERKSSPLTSQRPGQTSQNLSSGSITPSKNDVSNNMASSSSSTNFYSASSYQNHQKGSITHSTNPQPQQNSTFPGQYPASQSAYPSTGQTQFPTAPNAAPFPTSGQTPQYNSTQNQFSSGQSQYSSGTSNLPHQSQYPAGAHNNYSGQSQYSGYQNSSSFPSHPPQSNFPSSQSGGPSAGLYPTSTQTVVSSYTSQSNSYQSPSAGSYHSRDNQTNVPVSTQSSGGVSFPSQAQPSNLKPASTQSGSSYNSQSFNTSPAPLQPSPLASKLGDSLSKMAIKDSVLENHQSSQYEHASSSSSSVPTSLSLPSATSTSLSSGTNTISSTSTGTSVTSTSRIVSMPSTCKAPPNIPPGVPVMGQYIMGQSAMPPFYSVQPPLYGYEDVQLLQQRVPLQTGSYYDMSTFPAPAGSTLATGRDQQPPIPNVPFSGTSDTSKMPRVDAQSPNASTQPQNAHSAAQQPLFNFHYSYIYPSTMFPGAAGLQYPTMFPIPPVTNTAAHAGTTATTQFQKTYPSHGYSNKGYDELNQAQDFSKSGYGSSQNSGKASGTRMSTSQLIPFPFL